MASVRLAVVTSAPACTVAISAARLTLASLTPGSFFRAFSTRPAQEAQVMPWMGRVIMAALYARAPLVGHGGSFGPPYTAPF